jgi:hypothetical protein
MSGAATGGVEAHSGVLQEWFGSHWWTSREVVLVAAAAILLPLVLRKRVGTYERYIDAKLRIVQNVEQLG